jgi:hypothetical protein
MKGDEFIAEVKNLAELGSNEEAQGKAGRGRAGRVTPCGEFAAGVREALIEGLRAEATGLSQRTEYIKDGRFVTGQKWATSREIPRERIPVFNRYESTDFSAED